LGWLGLVVGVAGLLSIIPPLSATAYVFGLLLILWFAWLGIAMLRSATDSRQQAATSPEPVAAMVSM
jgi:threonine/homoserine/homoserine lactone efflux protein